MVPGKGVPRGHDFSFDKLTRKHGIKIIVDSIVSVEKCVTELAKVVAGKNIKSASRMNKAVVVFLSSEELVHRVVQEGLVIEGVLVSVLPLAVPARKIIISNVPPYLKNELLVNELSRHGKIMSEITMIPLGCKAQDLKHVISFRRQVYMLLNNPDTELNIAFRFRVDGSEYIVFASSEQMKCYVCGRVGHIAKNCKRSAAESDVVESDTEEGAAEPASSEAGVSAESVRVELDTVGTTEAVAGVSAESVRVEPDTVGTTEAVAEPEVAGQGGSDREQVCDEVKEGSEGGDELQVSEQTGIGMVIEGGGGGEVGRNEDVAFKFPKRKRIRKVQHSDSPAKCGMSLSNVACDERAVMEVEGSVPKKGVASQALEHDSADSDGEEGGSDTDSLCSFELSASQQARGGYSAQSIQKFLEFVKDRRGINVRDHFPDVMLFVGSANQVMRDAAALGLEKKEKDRLKYWISKVRVSLKKE